MARDPEDDFVFTLSDEEAPNVDSDGETTGNSKSLKAKIAGTKRRRDDPDNAQAEQSANTKKRKKQKKGGKNATNGNKTDKSVAEDAEGEDEEFDEDENGVLNPDFEFDVGGVANGGLVEDFDGWGDEGRNKSKATEKKGVDIDDILDRRRQKKLDKEERDRKTAKRAAEEDMEDDEAGAEEDDDMHVDLDNDELLAPDVFGMGAQDASESEEEEEAGSDEDGEDDDTNAGDGDDDDDSDSVASAVPHPDDLASDEDESGSDSEDDEEIRKQNEFFAPDEQAVESKSNSGASASFQNLSLSRPILRGLASVGFSTPTPIQRKTIPVALLGKDVVGGAVTGSGKTAAFIVPILERLLYRPRKVPTSRVAILMPTRELAVQCYNVATKLATFTDITFCQLVGGFSLREQENILKKRPDVIIATPGRFIDHMRNSASFTVDTLEILILDEADRMLEDGFAEELNEILTTIPKSRQTMLFSATMTSSVDKLIRVGLNKPIRLMVDSKKQTVGTLVQEFVRLRPGREDKRLAYLMFLCKTVYTSRVIVFFRQKKEAHRVRIVFGLMGLKAAELHGSMSQEQRIKSVEDFRDGKVSYLLATDLASRGLDIKGVETVINYEAPQSHEIYLHRVGRTARAGRSGRACTIAAEPDRKVVKEAVKAGRAQGAKIVSRVIDPAMADKWAEQVNDLATEVEEVLQEEKEEKQLAQAEMQVTRGKNLIGHQDEIMSRPKRTWFESEKDKRESKKRGLIELNGPDSVKKGKKKLSGKDKKKLDDTRMREEGRVWKKGKAEREAKPGRQGKGKKSVKGGKKR
ncbi:nucleolar DEAD-box protein required for synthesis of 60S ribosomal subunit [Microsporum audouinii]